MSLEGSVAWPGGKKAFSSRCGAKCWISASRSPEKSKTERMEILAPGGVGMAQNLNPKEQLGSLDVFLWGKGIQQTARDTWREIICHGGVQSLDPVGPTLKKFNEACEWEREKKNKTLQRFWIFFFLCEVCKTNPSLQNLPGPSSQLRGNMLSLR